MTTPSSAAAHANLLRDSITACAASIQGPDTPGTPAENARRILRHTAFVVHDSITGRLPDSVATGAGLARDYAGQIAQDQVPSAPGLDRECARTVRDLLGVVEDKVRHTFSDMPADRALSVLKMLRAASTLTDAAERWGGNADAVRAAERMAKATAAHLKLAAAELGADDRPVDG